MVRYLKEKRPFVSRLAVWIVLVAACAETPVFAGAPQAVTIVTHLTFYPDTTYGTLEASGPICSTGTVSLLDAHFAEGPAAYNVNLRQLFVCNDSSGTFVIRLLTQGNARPKDGFTSNGPWAISGDTGTGAYRALSGHGEIGVVVDFSADPSTGVETYVGFVTLE